MDALGYAWDAVTHGSTLLAAVIGITWGIVGGSLPGISASIAIALLLPFTYGMDPVPSLVMLACAYHGAEYGGSIPAILIRTPAHGSAAATVADGYAMHQQGRGGEALGISLVSGVIGNFFGVLFLVFLTKPLGEIALIFTPPAYFALGILGISIISSLSNGAFVKGLVAAIIGLMISTVGLDPLSGVGRFTFGVPDLLGGIDYILVLIGVFALSELWRQAGDTEERKQANRDTRIKLPGRAMLRRIRRSQIIGTAIGIFEGCIPGAGGTVAAFLSYNEAKRWSREPELFGHGAPEGIAAPEAANNAISSSALIPTLSFGIPGSNSSAILLGGLILHGLDPGPLLVTKNPEVVYGLFGGLFFGNIAMLAIGILVLTPAIWLVNRPKPYLLATVYILIVSGIYSIEQSTFDLWIVIGTGILGYFMRLLGFPVLPLVLGCVLGHMIEANYRRSLVVSSGDYTIFFHDPVSLILLIIAAIFVITSLVRDLRERKLNGSVQPA
ncbi:MAG TPA: tripartite tricarboxylate transporter permease [Dongiaceae bacterium]|jgi:putative tricarboxylic transport membrane protein